MTTNITRKDWIKGTSSAIASSLIVASAASAQSVTMEGFTPTADNPIRFSANENPYGISKVAQNAMVDAFSKSHLYFVEGRRELGQLIADKIGIEANNILTAAGSKEILKIMGVITGIEGGSVMAANPTYHDLWRYANWTGTPVKWVPVKEEDMTIDLDAMRAAYTDDVKVIYICNPNNPIPTILEKNKLRDFVLEMSKKCYVLVDEAYHEFVTDPNYESMAKLATEHDNIIVSRTASKIHGFAGIRVGFGITKPDMVRKMFQHSTGTVATPSVHGAIASYKDQAFQDFILQKNQEALNITYKLFEKHNVRHFKSNSNFTFFETGMDHPDFRKRLLKHGVDVGRPFPPFPTWSRVSMAKPEDMEYFAKAYEKEFV